MSLLERTKLLLRTHRISPNKLMGQNFMIDSSIFQSLVEYASLDKNDVALDIGAGFGFLTQFLAQRCKQVIAVEADGKLASILHEQFKDNSGIEIVHGNVLRTQISEFNKIVAIPPYQISSRLVLWFFKQRFDCAVAIFQKEFAERLIAPVGSDSYGVLTVLTYFNSHCELLDEVPKDKFYPQPKVDSVIIRLQPKQPPFNIRNETLFAKLVKSLFTQRNRKVRNAILPFLKGISAMSPEKTAQIVATLPFRDKRARELAPEDFGALANALA